MNKFFKTAVLAAAVTAATLTTSGLAEARDRHHHHNNNNAAWAAGAAGLVTGVIVGGAIANSGSYYDGGYYAPRRVYVEPEYRPVRRVYRERPVYVGGYEPWSPGWYRYCEDTYRSFNPRTGTFRGYDGLEHFCNAS